ncbi:hypothetical protein HU200_011580 [Digitaria exilis]|uniref:Potassium transporter n=1 Tax=Digitaria exilis TaxID=1010633 RepID=A0A835FG22_9POAL|nr:hypothetical protein HU200_011580 [Digitaria exilis]
MDQEIGGGAARQVTPPPPPLCCLISTLSGAAPTSLDFGRRRAIQDAKRLVRARSVFSFLESVNWRLKSVLFDLIPLQEYSFSFIVSQVHWKSYCKTLSLLAFQSFGVVYGDLSTSPLYVYRNSLSGRLNGYLDETTIFGLFSLIFWTFTLVPLLKYVLIVLSADDNGEGGTFALYSLLCRHAKFSLLPNQQAADEELSTYYQPGTDRPVVSSPFKSACFSVVTSNVVPNAVLSAISGLQDPATSGLADGWILFIACVVLVGLFALQHRGTHRVAFMFAPIVMLWLFTIGAIGVYNIIHWNPRILVALSPHYIVKFFKTTGRDGWMSLGGVLLAITGTEAMFADLGHFTAASIRLAFVGVIYPCLVLQYMGQAAFLSKNIAAVNSSFYLSIPSLACITVMFITTCLMSLVIIFVWQKNILISLLFLLFFGSLEAAYLSSAVMKVPQGGWAPVALALVFMSVMYVWHYGTRRKYLFDLQNKVSMKWILNLGPSLGIMRVPGIGLIYTELVTGVPAIFSHFVTNLPAFHQVLVFVCVKSVPVPYVPADERYLIGRIGPREYRLYRCIVRYGYKDVQKDDENFENHLVMSIARFIQMEAEESASSASYESSTEGRMAVVHTTDTAGTGLVVRDPGDDAGASASLTRSSKSETLRSLQSIYELESAGSVSRRRRVRFQIDEEERIDPRVRDELSDLLEAKEAGVAYIIGHSYVKARKNSNFLKTFAINYAYSFLRKNCRGPSVTLHIPHISLIEVGMIYYV